jgi:outer membrane protein OmpA-like peptidoglycan-associated protein
MVAALALTTLAGPALAQDRWDWHGGAQGDPRDYGLIGRGVPMLAPELRDTRRGNAFVMRNFDFNRDGRISPREAQAANDAFLHSAGPDPRRFDWEARDRAFGEAPPPPPGYAPPLRHEPGPPVRWDREGMRAYHFRDTPQGARMTLSEDVLFQTASAALRPGAIDKLRTLAGYLQGNPGVRIAIDGYTDSRGGVAYNQDLSERRAASVRAALDEMGVTQARFVVRGHGEADPVASNATPDGMRLNRRVEVTLLGQRADTFAR